MRFFSFCLITTLFPVTLCAQPNNLLRFYSSVEHHQDLIRRGDIISNFRSSVSPLLSSIGDPEREELTIPVIFNVLYTPGSERISSEEIIAQIERLNDDFSGLAEVPEGDRRTAFFPKNIPLQTDANIRFCFASLGILQSAINYRPVDTSLVKDIWQITNPKIGLPAILPSSYLNVWIMPREGGDAGFAQFPGGPNEIDGIVISQDLFGVTEGSSAPFSGGRTLTHLVGNYLGLLPLWGQSPCGDDGIRDTPVHNGPNFGESGYGHLSFCPGNPREMTMNFMDSGNDDQLYSFTPGQIKYMRAVLSEQGPRGGLIRGLLDCSLDVLSDDLTIPDQSVNFDVKKGLTIFPNPSHDETTITIQEANIELSAINLMDMSGREVYSSGTLSGVAQFKLNTSSYKPGLYFISVQLSSGEVRTKRLIVK